MGENTKSHLTSVISKMLADAARRRDWYRVESALDIHTTATAMIKALNGGADLDVAMGHQSCGCKTVRVQAGDDIKLEFGCIEAIEFSNAVIGMGRFAEGDTINQLRHLTANMHIMGTVIQMLNSTVGTHAEMDPRLVDITKQLTEWRAENLDTEVADMMNTGGRPDPTRNDLRFARQVTDF